MNDVFKKAAAFLIERDDDVRRLGVHELWPSLAENNQEEFVEQYVASEEEVHRLRAERNRLARYAWATCNPESVIRIMTGGPGPVDGLTDALAKHDRQRQERSAL